MCNNLNFSTGLYVQPPLTDSAELSRRPVRLLGINTWDVAAALTHLDWSLFKSIHEVSTHTDKCMWCMHRVLNKFIFMTDAAEVYASEYKQMLSETSWIMSTAQPAAEWLFRCVVLVKTLNIAQMKRHRLHLGVLSHLVLEYI